MSSPKSAGRYYWQPGRLIEMDSKIFLIKPQIWTMTSMLLGSPSESPKTVEIVEAFSKSSKWAAIKMF